MQLDGQVWTLALSRGMDCGAAGARTLAVGEEIRHPDIYMIVVVLLLLLIIMIIPIISLQSAKKSDTPDTFAYISLPQARSKLRSGDKYIRCRCAVSLAL